MLKNVFRNLSEVGSLDYQEIQTDSGLKIFFLKDESLPFIQYRVFFPRAGSDYDEEGKSGLSYLTAFLTDQGAGGLSSEALQDELNQLGTGLEIDAGRQTVSMVISGLSWHAEKLWELFGKILTEPHFQDEEMEILRKQFLDQRLKKLDDPTSVSWELWRRSVFQGSVAEPMKGTLKSLSKVTLEDVKTFYKKRFQEGQASLIVVGQYEDSLKENIISFFNKNFSYVEKKVEKVSSPELASHFRLVTKEDLLQANILIGYPTPSFPVDEPDKFLALKVANTVLGGHGMSSRMFVELREKRGLTYDPFSYIDFGKLYGVFLLSGSTKTVREFLDQALVVLNNFREKGVTLEELQRVKQEIKSRYLKQIETSENHLNLFVYYAHYLGVDPDFVKNYLKILKDISLDDLNRLIKEFILSKPLQVLIYGHPSLQSQLEGVRGLPSLKVVSFEDYFKKELSLKSK